jgi:hypothetical protein
MASSKKSISEYWKEVEAQNAADASKLSGKRQRNPPKKLRESNDDDVVVAPVEPAKKKKSTNKRDHDFRNNSKPSKTTKALPLSTTPSEPEIPAVETTNENNPTTTQPSTDPASNSPSIIVAEPTAAPTDSTLAEPTVNTPTDSTEVVQNET